MAAFEYDIVMKQVDDQSEITYKGSDPTYTTYIANGRYAIFFDPGAQVHDLNKTRVPATEGSFVMRNGNIGNKIKMSIQYMTADATNLEGAIAADFLLYATKAYDITVAGKTYKGCNLDPGSQRRIGPVSNTGRDIGTLTQVFVTIACTFSEDNPGRIDV
ncbi:hypothetical protein KAR91_63115 [Candidatus Pacearchaeota archaeon]|nr:hypothetical protein [Candidatus Pacearchaeota archaeon]